MEEVVRQIKKEEIEIGLKLGREQVIHNLILKLNLSDEQICDLVPVNINFVKKLRAKLKNNKADTAPVLK